MTRSAAMAWALAVGLSLGVVPASADVTINLTWDEEEGIFTTEHRDAIRHAADLWERWLQTSPTGQSITLTAENLWDPDHASAFATPELEFHAAEDVWQTTSQAGYRTGTNQDMGVIGYSTTVDWYTGTDGDPVLGQPDMVTSVLHEFGHLLGMVSSYQGGTAWGFPHFVLGGDRLTHFDTFLRDGFGSAPQPGTAGAFVVDDPITFVGPMAQQRHGGPVSINVPEQLSPAQIAHPYELGGLMTYGGRWTSQHGLFAYEVGMYEDLGWQFAYPSSMQSSFLGFEPPWQRVWANGASWDWGLPPTSDVDVTLHLPDAQFDYTLIVDRSGTARDLDIRGSQFAQARLQVDGSLLQVRDVAIGRGEGANGEVQVAGISQLQASEGIQVGYDGLGRMMLLAGGRAFSSFGTIGREPGSTGIVTVNGTDGSGNASTWHSFGGLNIGVAGSGTLTIQNGAEVINTFSQISIFDGSEGTVTVTGANSTWTNTQSIIVGGQGTAALTINAGGSVANTAGLIGLAVGSIGTVTVSGADASGTPSTWTNTGNLTIGGAGAATLSIADQALVHVEQTVSINANSTVNLDGGTLRFDGYDRNGTFDYVAGTIQLAGDRTIGTDAAIEDLFGGAPVIPSGKGLTVEGDAIVETDLGIAGGNLAAQSALGVGSSGTGTVTIEEGGHATSDFGSIGRDIGASGAVTVRGIGGGGTPSTWSTGALYVGDSAASTGTLTIEDGAAVANSFGTIGNPIGSDGTVVVSGAGSNWSNSHNLTVGSLGSGNLTISDGGSVASADGTIALGPSSSGEVLVTGPGSNWTSSGRLTIGARRPAALAIEAGGAVSNADAWVGEFSTATGAVNVTGPGSNWTSTGSLYLGGTDTAAGGQGALTLGPGGSVSVEETFKIWPSGDNILSFVLAGDSFGSDYGHLDVGGLFDLSGDDGTAGTLEVLLDDYAPLAGHSFNLFDFDTLTGEFALLALPALSDGLSWDTSALYTEGMLAVAGEAISGDFNNDGVVDAADYTVWRDGLGTDFTPADYGVWKNNFGATAGATGPDMASAVPEPASLWLVLLGYLGCMFTRAGGFGGNRRRRLDKTA